MTNYKRMLLAVIVLASLTGCGSSSDQQAQQSTTQPTTQVVDSVDPPQAPVQVPIEPPVDPIEPPTASPPTVTTHFSGVFACGGAVDGEWTNNSVPGIISTNVRGLTPNTTYRLNTWLVVVQGCSVLPDTTFMDGPSQTVEYCIGKCQFGSPIVTQYTFKNSDNIVLNLVFVDGVMAQSSYGIACPPCVPSGDLTTGRLY